MKRSQYLLLPVLLTAGILVVLFSLLAQPTYAGQDLGNQEHLPNSSTAIGDLAYVTLSNDNQVALVDTATYTVTGTVDVGVAGCTFPWQTTMSPDGAYVYVGCYNSGNVAIIETTGNTVVTTVGGIPSADGIAFTRDGAYALVGSRFNNQIAVVDTASYFMTYIPTPDRARSVAVHPYLDRAYATSGDGHVLVIDMTTF
ncbi:MAG: hypothetical protein KAS38_12055, partial [Anaerolineales bacterium]|nr:hypothetical protein [Anaerolineales bacterium]